MDSIEHVYDILERQNNVLFEYIVIKNALKECQNKFDYSFARYVDIKKIY
jgi:hypothetical protein